MAILTLALFLFRLIFAEGDGGGDGGEAGSGDGDGDGDGDGGDGGKGGEGEDHWKQQARRHEREAKAARKQAKDLEDRLGKIEGESKTEHEKALEAAKVEARKEATAEGNQRIIRSELKALAGTKLIDPSDAPRYIDLDDFEVDANGEIDAKKAGQAIDDLLKERPHLAAKPGKKLDGDGDQGPRGNTKNDDEITPGMGRLRAAYADTSKK